MRGKVLDIGGGKTPSYLRFFKKSEDARLVSVDLTLENSVDLESEKLPYKDKSADQVLLFNILEHIYNHKFLASEVHRVLKDDGLVIGLVDSEYNVFLEDGFMTEDSESSSFEGPCKVNVLDVNHSLINDYNFGLYFDTIYEMCYNIYYEDI